jgi:hypothetical protein
MMHGQQNVKKLIVVKMIFQEHHFIEESWLERRNFFYQIRS